jgi:predicted Holliday junction resolvase-like endonuclease
LARIYFYTGVRKHRKQAVKQSKATTLGYVNEKIAPILPNFPYNYKDLTFLGKGVDYVVFDGLSEGRVKQVVLLEIKSGKSRLNKNEKLIKEAVDKGKVKYKVLRINN